MDSITQFEAMIQNLRAYQSSGLSPALTAMTYDFIDMIDHLPPLLPIQLIALILEKYGTLVKLCKKEIGGGNNNE